MSRRTKLQWTRDCLRIGADSLDAVEIIMGIEDELGITVPQEELESKNLATVGDVYELINDTMA